jgi:hypothetical protein
MTQNAALELPEDEVGVDYFEECSAFPSAGPSYKFKSFRAEDATVSGASAPIASVLFGRHGRSRRIQRSEERAELTAPLWLTSLHKLGVFEVVPTENVSKLGLQLVTQEFWEPGELVLVSSPPGLCVQGSVVYSKKLPSDDYVVGIRLDVPVEKWIETLGLGGLMADRCRSAA